MTATLTPIETRTVTLPVGFFSALRATVDASGTAVTIDAVRDAGYRAGQSLFDGFASWLNERGESAPETLADVRFMALSSEYLNACGWGHLDFTMLSDAVVALDSTDWAEAEGEGSGCHVSTGLFAGFFGRLANAPIAVLEVSCRASGDARCRFLLGSVDVLGYVHEAMGRGIPYDRAAASA